VEVVPQRGALERNGNEIMSLLFSTLPSTNECFIFFCTIEMGGWGVWLWGVKRRLKYGFQ